MTIAWSKRPTYEEVLKTLDADYKVKLPDRTAVSFYDSFAMGQFREMQQQITTSQQATDAARDHAMGQAAEDENTSKAAILKHAEQMNARNSAALGEVQRQNADMQRTHEESRSRQAEEMARLIGQQQIERDNRDRMIEKLNTELRSHPQVVPTPIAAPAPDHSAAIIQAVHATANAIRGQASQDSQNLYQGFAHTTGELVRNLQQSHTQGLSQLMNNLSRGFPTVNNLFQSNTRHIHDHRQITVAPDPAHGPSAAAIEDEAPKEDKKLKDEKRESRSNRLSELQTNEGSRRPKTKLHGRRRSSDSTKCKSAAWQLKNKHPHLPQLLFE